MKWYILFALGFVIIRSAAHNPNVSFYRLHFQERSVYLEISFSHYQWSILKEEIGFVNGDLDFPELKGDLRSIVDKKIEISMGGERLILPWEEVTMNEHGELRLDLSKLVLDGSFVIRVLPEINGKLIDILQIDISGDMLYFSFRNQNNYEQHLLFRNGVLAMEEPGSSIIWWQVISYVLLILILVSFIVKWSSIKNIIINKIIIKSNSYENVQNV